MCTVTIKANFMGRQSVQSHRKPQSEKLPCLNSCFAVTNLKFLIIFFFNERLQIFTLHLASPDSWPTGVGQEKRAHIIQSKMSQKEKNKYIYGSISMESRKMALINLFAGQQWDTDSENWHADPAREGEGKPNWDSSIETQALWNW